MSRVIDARWSALLLISVLVIFYIAAPIFVNGTTLPDSYWLKLARVCAVAVVAIVVGSTLPIFDRQFGDGGYRLRIRADVIHGLIWCAFLIMVVLVISTADNIPIFSALQGETAQVLSEQRANFLKMRSGWEAGLNYASAVLTSDLVPFSIAALFLYKQRYRWCALAVFLVYCELSLEKILYLKALLPLLYLALTGRIWTLKSAVALAAAMCALLYINTALSRGSGGTTTEDLTAFDQGSNLDDRPGVLNNSALREERGIVGALARPLTAGDYFTARYRPLDTIDQLSWRLLAVPVFTAGDSLKVFQSVLGGQFFMGASSTLISAVTGMKRVPFEAMVHGFEYSDSTKPSPTGRSNAAFFIEAFVNFGWLGVVGFSLFIGQSLRWFRKTCDPAFEAVWPLYVINLFQSGLIGNLLSNGFAVFFFIGLFVRVDYGRDQSHPSPDYAVIPRPI